MHPQPRGVYDSGMGTELTRKRTSWGPEGACTRVEVRDTYTADKKLNKKERKELRDTCAGCPVLRECRAWAIVHSLNYFIAGMMPYQVAALRSNEIEKWGYMAYKWGWLEADNLLTEAQILMFKKRLKDELYRKRHPAPPLPETYEVISIEAYVL